MRYIPLLHILHDLEVFGSHLSEKIGGFFCRTATAGRLTRFEDAVICSEILGITLTRRANGANNHIELAGFPHHALDAYLPKLVRAGKRVAICEQIQSPIIQKKMKSTASVTELITPGAKSSSSLTKAIESVKTAASKMSDWDNPSGKYRQLTFEFD